ncbi:MAG: hypothetical protein GVY18_07755 [Bacteroidetes bacterium]|jgi:hypothetical protein|nr:hypothetical protein [Bacteroidota bacterium]
MTDQDLAQSHWDDLKENVLTELSASLEIDLDTSDPETVRMEHPETGRSLEWQWTPGTRQVRIVASKPMAILKTNAYSSTEYAKKHTLGILGPEGEAEAITRAWMQAVDDGEPFDYARGEEA